MIAQGRSFEEDLIYFDSKDLAGEMHEQIAGDEASVYSALVLGTRDYMRKCGFQKAIIGLSGGIDSALTAVIAADAVGPENVIGVGMPGPYSSQGSIDDARALAKNLGIRFELLSINPAYEAYRQTLQGVFAGHEGGCDGREYPVARSRHAADGAVEQVWSDCALHRQQERTWCRLLHSLRRHGRRLGGHLRRAENLGLSSQPST